MAAPKHKGAKSELLASCWLLDSGYDVFRNVSHHGIADLIAMRNGECILIDVKSHPSRKEEQTGSLRLLKPEQIDAGVIPLRVFACGTCEFDLQPRRHEKFVNRSCDYCGSTFSARNERHRFCGNTCAGKQWRKNNLPANDNREGE